MPLILREIKGSKLTIQEMDGNLTYLNDGIEFGQDNLNSLANSVQLIAGKVNLGYPMDTTMIKKYITGDAGLFYILTSEDLGKLILTNNEESNVKIIVPAGLIKGDTIIKFIRTGTGTVQIYGENGVSIDSKNGDNYISLTYGYAELISYGSDTYFLIGDLSAS